MFRRRSFTILAFATALALLGCGAAKKSSSHTSPTRASARQAVTTPSDQSGPLTRAELIAKGDLICNRVNARRQEVTLRTQKDYARLLPLAAYESAAVADMRKLVPPSSMAQGWKQITAGAQDLAEATAKVGEHAGVRQFLSTPAVRSASDEAAKATVRMITAAKREGFTDCAHI